MAQPQSTHKKCEVQRSPTSRPQLRGSKVFPGVPHPEDSGGGAKWLVVCCFFGIDLRNYESAQKKEGAKKAVSIISPPHVLFLVRTAIRRRTDLEANEGVVTANSAKNDSETIREGR